MSYTGVRNCLWYKPIKTFHNKRGSHLFICILLSRNCNIQYRKPAIPLNTFIAFQTNAAEDIHLTCHSQGLCVTLHIELGFVLQPIYSRWLFTQRNILKPFRGKYENYSSWRYRVNKSCNKSYNKILNIEQVRSQYQFLKKKENNPNFVFLRSLATPWRLA